MQAKPAVKKVPQGEPRACMVVRADQEDVKLHDLGVKV